MNERGNSDNETEEIRLSVKMGFISCELNHFNDGFIHELVKSATLTHTFEFCSCAYVMTSKAEGLLM